MNRVEHGIAIGRAHLIGSRVRLSSYGVDEITRECMGCHDGSVAAERSTSIVAGQRGSHPVGTTYVETPFRGRKGQLRPKRELPEDVQLARDTVGCQSCHSPFSREESMLNATMRNSQLCLSCHDM